jgi:tetratricopeptide (TPR) repeat protein
MMADFQERAANGDFTEAELSAARWLDVLAEEDKELAAKKADELLAMELAAAKDKTGSAGSVLVQSRALDAARGAGIAVAAQPEPQPIPEPEPEPESDPILDPEPVLDDGGDTEGEVEIIDGTKPSKKKKSGKDDEKLGANQANPAKAAELAEQGMAALNAGRRSEATNLFNQSISYDSRNAMSLMGLSDIYFDTGSSQKALLYAEKAVQAAPKNANYRIKLGDAYFKVLRYRDALDEYKKAKAYGSTKADDRIAKAEAKIGG